MIFEGRDTQEEFIYTLAFFLQRIFQVAVMCGIDPRQKVV